MVTERLNGSVIWDYDENYIDKLEYHGKRFDSEVAIWWEAPCFPISPSYDLCYDKDAGFIFYRTKSDANSQIEPCSARILYGELYSTRRDEGIKIPIADAVKLLKDHPDYFDESINKPAQILMERYRDYDNTGKVVREYDSLREYNIPHAKGIY